MPEEPPLPFSGPRGIRGLYGSIQRLVSQGLALPEIQANVEAIYAQYGGRFTSQSAEALRGLVSQFSESNAKSIKIGNYISDASITSRHIAYTQLQRTIDEFTTNPSFNVRYHAVGSIDGAPIDIWRTAIYSGPHALPPSLFELSNHIASVQLPGTDGHIKPSDVQIAEFQITAV